MPCDLFLRTPLSLVIWCASPLRGRHFRVRRRSCFPQTESPLRRERVPQESALRDGAIWKSSHCWPGEENHCSKICALSAIPSAWCQGQHLRAHSRRVFVRCRLCAVSAETTQAQTCVRSPPVEILLGRVGVPHDSPTTRLHREGCNSGTAFVQGLQRLQSGHSGKAHWRPTRLDTRLGSARARGTLTNGGQAEKRQCFSRQSPARETEGNAIDGAKRHRGHGHSMQTTTPTGPEARRQGFGFEEGLLLSGIPDLRPPPLH